MTDLSQHKEYFTGTNSSDIESNRDDSSELESQPSSFRLDPRVISDAVLGLSDGMTVPFALTAGLSELGDNRVVVLAGLAELVAGAISMGLGGYLGAKSEKEIYNETMNSTRKEITTSSQAMRSLRIRAAFTQFNISADLLRDLASYMAASEYLPEFLMRFEHDMSEPADSRAITCALTIATGYFVGGFIPLLPYLLVSDRKQVDTALRASVVTMIVTLFLLGYFKACLISATGCTTGDGGLRSSLTSRSLKKGFKGGIQMLVVGGLSAGCAILLVKSFNSLL